MAWGQGSKTTLNAWTGSKTSTTGGRPTRPDVSSNPWSTALKAQYDSAKDTQSKYSADWSSAIGKARGLSDKDYTSELRRFAQEDVNTEKTDQNNQLGAMGMRELSLKSDVVDDWTKRRTDASSRAAITGQEMQLSALSALTNAISGASNAELSQISLALEAAKSGAAADQSWTAMENQNYDSDRSFAKELADEQRAKREADELAAKQRNADELAAWQARNAAYRQRTATPVVKRRY